jgi:polyribonucleotide nucleotidyltransferase
MSLLYDIHESCLFKRGHTDSTGSCTQRERSITEILSLVKTAGTQALLCVSFSLPSFALVFYSHTAAGAGR